MSSSVTVVHPVLPQSLPSKDVQLVAAGTLGEDRAIDRNVALENSGICLTLIVSGASENPGSSGITSSIFILSSRVVQVWCITIDHSGGRLAGRVVR
jgi:hypothetical protein